MTQPTPEEIKQNIGIVNEHHHRLRKIDATLASTPNPDTLRSMEHICKELPDTDDLKATVKSYLGSTQTKRKIVSGFFVIVFSSLFLTILAILWQGIQVVTHVPSVSGLVSEVIK